MPSGRPKDKKLAELRREITELTKQVGKEKDPKAKQFRQQQLARAQAALAKYLQDKPKE